MHVNILKLDQINPRHRREIMKSYTEHNLTIHVMAKLLSWALDLSFIVQKLSTKWYCIFLNVQLDGVIDDYSM